jgi:hypothetical protein
LTRHHDILEESISGSDESSTTFKSPVSQTTISREDDNSIGTPSAQPDAGSMKPPKLPRDEKVTGKVWLLVGTTQAISDYCRLRILVNAKFNGFSRILL